MSAITVTQFRADFPAFSDTQLYTDTEITFWLGVAVLALSEGRWDTLYNLGTELFTAHHMVLAARDNATSTNGGVVGAVDGPATAKGVDKVSKSMDASSVTLADGDFWNMSQYGIRFLRLARMIGAGGVQIGAGCP